MGLFSKILPALEVAGGIALLATGAGALAGGMLITQGIASSGLIGGSVGKFLKSDLGQGLMTAASLGATAYAMFGTDALQTSVTEMNNEVASDVDKMGAAQMAQATQDSANLSTADLVRTGVSFSDSTGVNTAMFPDQATASYNGVPQTKLTGASAAADPINPQANLSQTQQLQADQIPPESTGPTPGPQSATGAQSTAGSPQVAGANAAVPPEATGPTPDASGGQVPPLKNAMDVNIASPGTAPSIWDKLAANKFLNSKFGSSAVMGAGSAIGGIGQGILQQAAMDKQIAAWQEPNRSFGSSAGQGVIAASQAPITVPNGYLQRAAALKGMLSSGGAGAVPSANSPVPVWQMQSTPRGGVPGG